MGGRLLALLVPLCLLTGSASFLERTYTEVEPHSSRFWESEAAGTLRAENYQDIVNDLLILIGQHTETATLRLYNFDDDLSAAEALEQAAAETQQETPLGAYAVEYITSTSQSQRGYCEAAVQIGYRRTACFRYDSHRLSLPQRVQKSAHFHSRRVAVQFVKSQVVDTNIGIGLFQKPTGRTHILHDEMPYPGYHRSIIGRQYLFYGSIAQRHRNQV